MSICETIGLDELEVEDMVVVMVERSGLICERISSLAWVFWLGLLLLEFPSAMLCVMERENRGRKVIYIGLVCDLRT